MLLPLLILVGLHASPAYGQDGPAPGDLSDDTVVEESVPSDGGSTAAIAPAVSAVPMAEPNAELAVVRAKAREREQRQRSQRLMLAVVGLLLLWLLARNAIRERARGVAGQVATRPGQRPRRRIALSHDELGHLIFEAATGRHFHDFRDLFLNGPEAADLLGPDVAQAYLDQRNDQVLRRCLEDLAQSIDQGAVFRGVEPLDDGMLGLRVQYANGLEGCLPVGTVTRIEAGYRIHLPAKLVGQAAVARG
ncbi:MAG: hypothetical protein GXP62_20800 [Oligoflexia bacterium]|nr:hypothetical protein [Oligoflexia bacterium]